MVANLPYVREDEWAGLEPEITRYEPRGRAGGGSGRSRCDPGPGGQAPAGTRLALEHAPGPGPRGARLLTDAETRPDLAGRERVTMGTGAVTPDEVATFGRCISVGGVALFPADTVYGLATEPDSREGVDRLYRLKGRPPAQPAAVMFFRLDLALEALPELGRAHADRGGAAAAGALTLVLPNPARRFPLACGPVPDRLGLRVPSWRGARAAGRDPLAGAPVERERCTAEPDARRVDRRARARPRGVDLILDAGELPGMPSTVVSLVDHEAAGGFEILREGAVRAADVEARLR